MSDDPTHDPAHVCVYFDDGGLELLCACGARAFYLLTDDGETDTLVLVEEDPQPTYAAA